MTSFFTDLEDQLRTAAREHTPASEPSGEPPRRKHRRRRWLAGGAHLVPVVAAVAVTLAIVGGALVLLGHRGGQPPASPAPPAPSETLAKIVSTTPTAQLHREYALIGDATKKVLARPACRVMTTGPVKTIRATPGEGLLSTLGLLRRPATAADTLPPDAVDAPGPGTSVYAGAARRVLGGGRTATFIMPIRESPSAGVPSDRCFALQTAALRQSLPSMPQHLRSPTLALAAAVIGYARDLAGHRPVDAICEVTVMTHDGLSSGCGMTAAQIRSGMLPDQNNGTFSGLVPDGVTSVTLRFAAAGGRPAHATTAQVHDNVYTVHVGGLPITPAFPTVVWHAADGRVLKTFSEPPKANPDLLRRVCAQHPATCAALVLATSAATVRSGSASHASVATRGG